MPYQTTLINSLTSEEKGRILAQKAKLLTCIYSVHYKKNEKPEKMKKKKISKKKLHEPSISAAFAHCPYQDPLLTDPSREGVIAQCD